MRDLPNNNSEGLSLDEVAEAVKNYYKQFQDNAWWGDVHCTFQDGRCIHVEARPILRHSDKGKDRRK